MRVLSCCARERFRQMPPPPRLAACIPPLLLKSVWKVLAMYELKSDFSFFQKNVHFSLAELSLVAMLPLAVRVLGTVYVQVSVCVCVCPCG